MKLLLVFGEGGTSVLFCTFQEISRRTWIIGTLDIFKLSQQKRFSYTEWPIPMENIAPVFNSVDALAYSAVQEDKFRRPLRRSIATIFLQWAAMICTSLNVIFHYCLRNKLSAHST